MNEIESPISKQIIFESKLKKLLTDAGFESLFLFGLPKEGEVLLLTKNLCGHQLLKLSETVQQMGEQMLEEDPHNETD